MAQVIHDEDPKKLRPLTVPKILEQLERALMDIKYNHSCTADDELIFNKIGNVPIKTELELPTQFIGKELMLFEMVGILNGKISELQKKYEKIKSIEQREEGFVSSRANEITAPIQQIFDYAKLAKSGQMNQDDAWQGILDVAKRLENVTTVVLDTNRVDNDSLKLSLRNEKINDIITNAVSVPNSTEPEVAIIVGLDHDIEIPVDKVRLSQVLQTILNNSIEFTEVGHIKVESFVAHEQNIVIIRISDTGKGLSQEVLSKIFEKKATKTREPKNSNNIKLSLYLCKGILKAHGGNITAKNNKNAGATFTITLPIKRD